MGRGEKGSGNLAEDTEISRRHARFHRENGNFVVEDLGSTNGTYVNGRRLAGPAVLSPGDEIQLGKTLVKFDGVTEQTKARPALDLARSCGSATRTRACLLRLPPRPPHLLRPHPRHRPSCPQPVDRSPESPPLLAGDGPACRDSSAI